MCGIVGYLGPLNPKDVILQGLKKLEYRGYDSAGVAILHDGIAKQVRASGKLSALEILYVALADSIFKSAIFKSLLFFIAKKTTFFKVSF